MARRNYHAAELKADNSISLSALDARRSSLLHLAANDVTSLLLKLCRLASTPMPDPFSTLHRAYISQTSFVILFFSDGEHASNTIQTVLVYSDSQYSSFEIPAH